MSMKAVKDAVKKSRKDKFEIGDVIRWTASNTYTYAAIKTAVGWVSTSRYDNGYVKSTMTFDELLEVIARAETSEVFVATAWEAIE